MHTKCINRAAHSLRKSPTISSILKARQSLNDLFGSPEKGWLGCLVAAVG
jgi:hypothetical protein